MNELELIQTLKERLPTNEGVIVGPGDDCAVLRAPDKECYLLFKTDSVVEGIHFLPATDPYKIGRKALARCLSDIAAMGGIPTAALIAIALPSGFNPRYVISVYDGLCDLARKYDVAIAGGETSQSPGPIMITVSILGWVEPTRCILRSTAKPGDAIFVTGELGGSILGKHLEFEPRVKEARWLVENFPVHAMIDLSDGLATDLKRILAASGVGAELLSDAIPISKAARERASSLTTQTRDPALQEQAYGIMRHTPLALALSEGEDYELLFTVPPEFAVQLLDAWKTKFPETRLSSIGKITAERSVTIRDRYGRKPLSIDGYIHFA